MKTKPKTALVPKATPRTKEALDNRIYLTKSGIRVRISRGKQFPVHPGDSELLKEMRRQANERIAVIRISDGHELWGYTLADLTLESEA